MGGEDTAGKPSAAGKKGSEAHQKSVLRRPFPINQDSREGTLQKPVFEELEQTSEGSLGAVNVNLWWNNDSGVGDKRGGVPTSRRKSFVDGPEKKKESFFNSGSKKESGETDFKRGNIRGRGWDRQQVRPPKKTWGGGEIDTERSGQPGMAAGQKKEADLQENTKKKTRNAGEAKRGGNGEASTSKNRNVYHRDGGQGHPEQNLSGNEKAPPRGVM